MNCPTCGSTMKKTKGTHHYIESGLNNIYITGILIWKCTCGEIMPEIPRIEDLHKLIAKGLVEQKAPLKGSELRFIRKQMGMSAKDFSKLLYVSPVTVSRWETGTENIGPGNEKLIRLIYVQTIEEECDKVFSVMQQVREINYNRKGSEKISISSRDLQNAFCSV